MRAKREFGSFDYPRCLPNCCQFSLPAPLERSLPLPDSLFFSWQPNCLLMVDEGQMEAFVVGATLIGSFIGAFAIQKAALAGLFHLLNVERRIRE